MGKVIDVKYICRTCGQESPENDVGMLCACGGVYIGTGVPGVSGTRDSFGVKKAFRDEKDGKVIDNWRSWEKAGYRNPLETIKNHNIKEGVKQKIGKIKHKQKG